MYSSFPIQYLNYLDGNCFENGSCFVLFSQQPERVCRNWYSKLVRFNSNLFILLYPLFCILWFFFPCYDTEKKHFGQCLNKTLILVVLFIVIILWIYYVYEIYVQRFLSRLPGAMIEYFQWHILGYGPLKTFIMCLFNYEFILFENLYFSKVFHAHFRLSFNTLGDTESDCWTISSPYCWSAWLPEMCRHQRFMCHIIKWWHVLSPFWVRT